MKKCKQGYYYCYRDKKCKRIPTGYRVGLGGYLRKETGEDQEDTENGNHKNGNGNGNGNSNGGSNGGGVSEGWSKKYKRSIDCNNPKGFSQRAHCQGRKKMNVNEEGLRDWFGKSKSKDGKKGWVNVVTGGTCASDEPGEGTPKCVSSAKRASMSKAERLSAQRRKKKADPGQQQKSGAAKPTYVSTDPKKKMKKEEVEIIEGSSIRQGQTSNKKVSYRGATSDIKRDKDGNIPASHYKKEKPNIVSIKRKDTRTDDQKKKHSDAVRKYDNYKKLQAKIFAKDDARKMKKEEVEVTEAKDKKGKGSGTKDACYHKVKSRYSVWPSAYASGALVKCRKVGAANWGNKSESYELSNWRDDFQATEYEFLDIVKPEPLKGETLEEKKAQKCWPGYEKKGTKKMFGKTYNNCVKKEEVELQERGDFWHPDPEKDRKLGGAGPNQRAREDRAAASSPKPKSDPKKLRPGESYYEYAKRQRSMKREEVEHVNEIHSQAHTPHEIPSGSSSKDLKKLSTKAAKRIDADVDGDVDTKDPKASEMGEFIPSPDGKKKLKPKVRFEEFSDWRSELEEGVMPAAIDPKAHRKQQRAAKVRNLAQKGATEGERAAAKGKTKGPDLFGEDWQKVNKSDKTDGMSAAAVKAYRRENPGSKLKTAVTGDPKPGSKDAKRRKSFCARSKGQQDMHNIDCSKTPDKPVCKARRRWKC